MAISLASTSSVHGWHGLARGLTASAEALGQTSAQLTAAVDEAEQALGKLQVVPARGATSEVSDQLETATVLLLLCRSALEEAGPHLDDARLAAERAEIPVLVVRGRMLGETVIRLRQQIEEIRAGVEAEYREALNLGEAEGDGPSGSTTSGSRRPDGPAAQRSPNSRHLLNRIGRRSPQKNRNTLVLPDVDVSADLQDIQEGRARWNRTTSRYETPGGRTYGVEEPSGTVFPDSGPGFIHLGRHEYHALKHYIQADGDRRKAEEAMTFFPALTESVQRRAYEVFKHHKSFRGE
ncbi:hypothetical protein [Kineosporia mesophila]|uniref:hypothetical protein n=1 Tax=Kineosporia mesophila TaxID=566012 RepID=UPI001E30685B|nr:hypothetical protein [Kineosporia mesophila]MCD5349533.1 hypothetical protein [Kineosporia mesophila]